MAKTLGDITQELNEKVLTPAKAEATELLRNAQQQAADILAKAQADAEKIRSDAKTDAENTKKQFQVDMDTAARNFVIMVQERLESSVVSPIVEKEIKDILGDANFLKQMIEILLTEFVKEHGRERTMEIILPKRNQEDMEKWFIEKFRGKMTGALTLHFTDKITFGFHLGIEGQGAHFNFGTGLVEAFSNFCSPRFRKHFFAREE